MRQREVQDAERVRWTCIQALGGLEGAAAERAADRLESDEGTVPVVCTPSGGAQSVRLELERGWEDALSDEDLLEAIGRTSERAPHG
jgi:hypothetical protein